MSEDEKTKVSRKAILPFVAKMAEPIETLETVINEMPESGAKKSFGITLSALKKKFSNYSSGAVVVVQGETLTDKEKIFLEKFRAGEISIEKEKEEEKPAPSTLSDDKTASKKSVAKKKK